MSERGILTRLTEARAGLEGEGWKRYFKKYPSRRDLEMLAASLAPPPPGEGMTYGEAEDNFGDWQREIGILDNTPEVDWTSDAFDKSAEKSEWDPRTGRPLRK